MPALRIPRPRFSLMSFLLAAALVCVSVCNWQTSRRVVALSQTVKKLRDELGYIEVHDPAMAYIRQLPTFGQRIWRFRVYLPPNRKFTLRTNQGSAKTGALPPRGGSSPFEKSGSFNIAVSIEQKRGRFFVLAIPEKGTGNGASSSYIDVPVRLPNSSYNVMGEQRELSPEDPIVLVRQMSPDGNGGESGVAVFFEAVKPD